MPDPKPPVAESHEESFADKITRLELMADGDPTWDLSDNDRAAMRNFAAKKREAK